MFKFLRRRGHQVAPNAIPPSTATEPPSPPPSPRPRHRAELDGPSDDSAELRCAGQARIGRGRHAGQPQQAARTHRPSRSAEQGQTYTYGAGLLSGYDVPGGPNDLDADGVPDRYEGGPFAGTDSGSAWTSPDPAPSAPDPAPAPDSSGWSD